MAKIVYSGGFDAVDVPAYGLEGVARGEEVTVTKDEAEAICVNPDWSIVEPKTEAPKINPPVATPPPVVEPDVAATDGASA